MHTQKRTKCTKCGKSSRIDENVNDTWFWSGSDDTVICTECADADFQNLLDKEIKL